MKFLVVDDFGTMRKIVSGILKECGVTDIKEADDGDNALVMLKSEKFDFVVTDWNMPRMQGIELLRHIRADENLKNLPVLLITAEAKKENIITAAQAGADGYIVKPFNQVTLQEKLTHIFKRKGLDCSILKNKF